MNKVLTVLAVLMMGLMGFGTAHADAREQLVAAANSLNESCPMGDDVTLQSVKVEGDNLVVTYVMEMSKAELDMVKSAADEMAADMAADMRGDETFNELYALCKAAKCNFVIRFSNKSGQYVDLSIPNSKL